MPLCVFHSHHILLLALVGSVHACAQTRHSASARLAVCQRRSALRPAGAGQAPHAPDAGLRASPRSTGVHVRARQVLQVGEHRACGHGAAHEHAAREQQHPGGAAATGACAALHCGMRSPPALDEGPAESAAAAARRAGSALIAPLLTSTQCQCARSAAGPGALAQEQNPAGPAGASTISKFECSDPASSGIHTSIAPAAGAPWLRAQAMCWRS